MPLLKVYVQILGVRRQATRFHRRPVQILPMFLTVSANLYHYQNGWLSFLIIIRKEDHLAALHFHLPSP
ncbi:Uncharacterised protein [Vibrio cholerae]|nr:Uncharacterised protein [Vibrio cholerae]